MGAILGFLPTLWTILGDLPKVVQAFGSLHQLILDAESKALSGADKLDAVLMDFEKILNDLAPSWAGTFDQVAKEVEAVVNEIVAMLNSFKNAAPTP